MRRRLASFALLVAGCHLQAQRPRSLPAALEVDQGEIYVYLQPLAEHLRRLSLFIAAVGAARSDGTEAPLELSLAEISGSDMTRQRLLAWGRLAPGSYRGFLLHVQRAALAGGEGEGASDLLVGKDPARADVPFAVARGRAYVAALSLRYEGPVDGGFEFTPAFSGAVFAPEQALTTFTGYCSNSYSSDLTVFDTHARTAVAAIATGREPQGVALDRAAGRAYVALAGEDRVEVLDLTTGESLQRIPLQGGDEPRELALTPDGRSVLVVNHRSNSAAFIDTDSTLVTGRIATGLEPSALLVDRQGRRAYVLNRVSNDITVIDLANRAVAATVRTDFEPLRAQLNRDGTRLYVIHGGSPYMTVFSVPDMAVATRIFVGIGASTIKVDARTDLLYLARRDEPTIQIFNPFSTLPIDSFDVPDGISWLAIDGVENSLLALMPGRRSVAFVDLTSKRLVSIVDVGREPYQVTTVGERN